MSKYGNFNFIVKNLIWLYIKRSLKGNLAIDDRISIYCPQIQENIQSPPNIADIWERSDFDGFGMFFENEHTM